MNQFGNTRIKYSKLLFNRKHPIADQEAVGNWFARFAAVRRRKLKLLHATQNGLCWYCQDLTVLPADSNGGHDMASLDHIVPQVRGGTDSLSNLVCACSFCNSNRGDSNPMEYRKRAKQAKQDMLTKQVRKSLRKAKRLQDKLDNPKKVLASWRFFTALYFMSYDEQWNAVMRAAIAQDEKVG